MLPAATLGLSSCKITFFLKQPPLPCSLIGFFSFKSARLLIWFKGTTQMKKQQHFFDCVIPINQTGSPVLPKWEKKCLDWKLGIHILLTFSGWKIDGRRLERGKARLGLKGTLSPPLSPLPHNLPSTQTTWPLLMDATPRDVFWMTIRWCEDSPFFSSLLLPSSPQLLSDLSQSAMD